MNGGAFNQWYGVGNLDHWLIPASVARQGGLLEGLGNAGWNHELADRIERVVGAAALLVGDATQC